MRYISIHHLIALGLAVGLAFGCSDANAAEATYLPVHEPCPSGFDGAKDGQLTPDTAAPTLPDSERPSNSEADDESNTDRHRLLDRRPWAGAALGNDSGPQFAPASTGFDFDEPDVETAAFDESDEDAQRPSDGVDINSADVDELTELTGIGPALAERIVDYRQQREFDSPTQIQRIEGIGPATYNQIASEITVE